MTTKGGDYFFMPSLTGLRLMAAGEVIRVMNGRPPPLAAPADDEAWPVRALRRLGWLLRLGQVVGSFREALRRLGGADAIVTPETYERLLSALELPDRPLQLTRFERPEPGEAAAVARMARRAALTVIETYCDGKQADATARAMRDQDANRMDS